jgi:hypothetical protein
MLSHTRSSSGASHLIKHLAGLSVRVSKKDVCSFRNLWVCLPTHKLICSFTTAGTNCLKSMPFVAAPSLYTHLSAVTNIYKAAVRIS